MVAKLLRTASTGLSSARLPSKDARGRVLIVLARESLSLFRSLSLSLSLSDSEPDWEDEMGAAGARAGAGVGLVNMEL